MEAIMNKIILITLLAFSLVMSAQPVKAECEPFFTGGGIITEGHGKDKLKITFAVNLFIYEGESALGSLQVNFHKTGEENVNHSDFKSIDNFTELWGGVHEFNGNEYMFVSFVATGQFNGEDGWSILARFSDFGEPGVGKRDAGDLSDAVRFTLIDPYSNLVYDTSLSFPREQVWRTLLDGGNLTFHCED
jgi:hypothetical protein